jgi:hypothetical protein
MLDVKGPSNKVARETESEEISKQISPMKTKKKMEVIVPDHAEFRGIGSK